MNKNLLLIFFLSAAFAGKGQNLVPNGDFEQYWNCPTGASQVYVSLAWKNPSQGTPDYFNQCSNPSVVGVPTNVYGYQNANSGYGYCGIIAGRYSPPWSEWREYIEVQLTSFLTANTCYHFEMFLSLSEESKYTSNDMGVYFSDTLIGGINTWQSLPYYPQIDFNLGFNTDTANWINISGNYTASGGEAFMIIGNFKDSLQTNLLLFNNNATFGYSYFYIDDVSLSPCTGIEEQKNEAIKIYPNPVKDEFQVSSRWLSVGFGEKTELSIYDMMGKEVLKSIINNEQSIINIQSLNSGIYFIEINNACLPDRRGKNVYRKKLLKE